MASDNVYNVYKRNGTSHNKVDSNQTKFHADTKANSQSKKLEIDNNFIDICDDKQEPKAKEGIILLSHDDFPHIDVRTKRYSKKHFESNKKMETRSAINIEAIESSNCIANKRLNNKKFEAGTLNLKSKNDSFKDGETNITNDVVKVVLQNLLDVAISRNMPRSGKLQSFGNSERESKLKCTFECDCSDVVMMDIIDVGVPNEGNLHSKNKTELEREMEIYEAFERDESRVIVRDSHEMLKEESKIATELPNEKKRTLEGNVYERKKKRIKHAQKLVTRTNNEEDVCFICFDGGDLVLCDRRYVQLQKFNNFIVYYVS